MATESAPLGRRPRAEVLRGLCGGAVHLPGDAAVRRGAAALEPPGRRPPGGRGLPGVPRTRSPTWCAPPPRPACKVAPQGTGHGAPPLAGRLEDAVLLRTSAMTELRVDAERRTARVGAGVLWGDVVERAGARAARGPAHLQPRRRRRRLLARRRAELVRPARTACSAVRSPPWSWCSPTARSSGRPTTDDSDLMWAARGGGGGFGVVTALEFDLLPVARRTPGCSPGTGPTPSRVLSAWSAWAATAPESVTSVARLFQAPDVPWLPADVRGRQLVIVDAVVLGDPDAARALLAPLRALRPEIDTFDDVPAASVARLHLDPEAPTAVYANSVLLDDLPERAVEALVAAAGPGSGSDLLFVEIRQLGGALSRPAAARRRAGPHGRRRSWCSAWALDTGRRVGGGARGRQPRDGRAAAVGHRVGVPPDGRRAGRRAARLAGQRPGSASSTVRAAADPHGLFLLAASAAAKQS